MRKATPTSIINRQRNTRTTIIMIIVLHYMLLLSFKFFFVFAFTGIAVAISTSTNWLTGYTFLQVFPFILSVLNSYGTLYMLAVIDILACLFVLFLLPETKVSPSN